MPVLMVNVRKMGMLMRQGFVAMQMLVRLCAIPSEIMLVLMVHVVNVPMRMRNRFVGMGMVMTFSQM